MGSYESGCYQREHFSSSTFVVCIDFVICFQLKHQTSLCLLSLYLFRSLPHAIVDSKTSAQDKEFLISSTNASISTNPCAQLLCLIKSHHCCRFRSLSVSKAQHSRLIYVTYERPFPLTSLFLQAYCIQLNHCLQFIPPPKPGTREPRSHSFDAYSWVCISIRRS